MDKRVRSIDIDTLTVDSLQSSDHLCGSLSFKQTAHALCYFLSNALDFVFIWPYDMPVTKHTVCLSRGLTYLPGAQVYFRESYR